MRSAPYWDLDASIFKQFPVGETRRFEFRAEAFNLFNTVIECEGDCPYLTNWPRVALRLLDLPGWENAAGPTLGICNAPWLRKSGILLLLFRSFKSWKYRWCGQ
jgi:hypothetical protein